MCILGTFKLFILISARQWWWFFRQGVTFLRISVTIYDFYQIKLMKLGCLVNWYTLYINILTTRYRGSSWLLVKTNIIIFQMKGIALQYIARNAGFEFFMELQCILICFMKYNDQILHLVVFLRDKESKLLFHFCNKCLKWFEVRFTGMCVSIALHS